MGWKENSQLYNIVSIKQGAKAKAGEKQRFHK